VEQLPQDRSEAHTHLQKLSSAAHAHPNELLDEALEDVSSKRSDRHNCRT
jgi:hypothetical protein